MSGLGITVMPEWIQSEGQEQVLDNLQRAGANAVATSPYVMAESVAADAAASRRLMPAPAASAYWTGRFGASVNCAV